MSERYRLAFDHGANHSCKMVTHADGEWVSHGDYTTLRSQLDAVTKERGELRQRVQQAEKAARTTIDDCRRQGVSLGRSLANYACKMERGRAERMEQQIADVRSVCEDLQDYTSLKVLEILDATPIQGER